MDYIALREELSKYGAKIVNKGLVVGPGGNISASEGGRMLISPSGFDLAEIQPEQWCVVDIESGQLEANSLRPSSEITMHLDAYRVRPDMTAIVHTHPANCIALGLIARELPFMFPDQAALIGSMEFIDYVVPTTQKLADAVAAKIIHSDTLLLENHGLVTSGKNLREAYYRTEIMEESARIYLLASAIRLPKVLTKEEVYEIQTLDSEAYRIALLQKQK
ncbi:class II aldolase/adducin family protein [Paenibacillus roseipurpureus]|uniref:Class II aldolase/adducin family protein n=1 Tax=Paenibacillus roseopurpureus TaxID=2918901 RepID=A0AA96LR70_9BACL|nr:class II aldolase/adducin family protein [Paenibacillus sp. MBLB1832]WNR45773.1 class II aldolase/adducin family protein [Paenibacillus sp. MBLB1832]